MPTVRIMLQSITINKYFFFRVVNNEEEPKSPTRNSAHDQESIDLVDENNIADIEPSLNDDASCSTSAKGTYSSSPSSIWELLITPKINKRPEHNSSIVDLPKWRAEDQISLAKVLRKLVLSKCSVTPQEDDTDVFMRSITMTIKKFSPIEQEEIIFDIANELENLRPLETLSYSCGPSSAKSFGSSSEIYFGDNDSISRIILSMSFPCFLWYRVGQWERYNLEMVWIDNVWY